jgi:hypothetical protein
MTTGSDPPSSATTASATRITGMARRCGEEGDGEIGPAAEIARDEAERRADQAGDHHHRDADQQRDARARR